MLVELAPWARSGTALAWGRSGQVFAGFHAAERSALSCFEPDGRVVWEREIDGEVRCLAVSPDGARVALGVARERGIYHVCAAANGEPEAEAEVPSRGWVNDAKSIAWLPDGESLIGVRGSDLARWDLSSGTVQKFERKHTDPVNHVAVSPDGKWAVSSDSTKWQRVWNIAKEKQVRRVSGRHYGAPLFSPDGKHVVHSGTWGAQVNEVGGKWPTLQSLPGPALLTTPPVFVPDSSTWLFGSGDALVAVDSRHVLRKVATASGPLCALAVEPSGARLATCGKESAAVTIWSTAELLDTAD